MKRKNKRSNRPISLTVALMILIGAATGAAQDFDDRSATARVLTVLSATATQDLDLGQVFSGIPKGMGNDSDEDLLSALQHLRYNKHEVILFHVTDKKHELEFEFQNRPYKFVDLESGTVVKLNPGDIRDEYKKLTRKFNEKLKYKCGQYKIDLIEADINNEFKDVLLPYLIKRRKLY